MNSLIFPKIPYENGGLSTSGDIHVLDSKSLVGPHSRDRKKLVSTNAKQNNLLVAEQWQRWER